MMYWNDSFTKMNWVGLGFLSLVNWFCLKTIFAAADQKLPYTCVIAVRLTRR